MGSKSFVKLLRKIIREEVRNAVRETLTETKFNQVTNSSINLSETFDDPMPDRPVAKKQFSKNALLNDILNETAATPSSQEMADWSSMNYRSEMAQAFGMERTAPGPTAPLATKGINGEAINMSNEGVATTVKAMTRDYSALMKVIDKKKSK